MSGDAVLESDYAVGPRFFASGFNSVVPKTRRRLSSKVAGLTQRFSLYDPENTKYRMIQKIHNRR